jgi:mannose-6-phosphate isomerase-like protein (cupin superfamily)
MGAIHRDECFFVVREGDLWVSTGNGCSRITSGDMVVSPAGSKRAGLAITDAVVTTFHANPQDEHDEEKIWDMLTVAPPDNALPMHRMKELSNA